MKSGFFQNKTKITILIIIFILYLLLRLFINEPYYFIGGDDAKYLTLARNFPHHTLDNHQLFLLHGPLYPYAIHFLNYIFVEDYRAGIVLAFLSSIASFYLLYNLVMLINKSFATAIITITLFTLSFENIFFSNYVQKESFMIMLFLATIYFYIKGILIDKRWFYMAAFFGAITALTTDHIIFVLACMPVAYLIFRNSKTQIKYAITPFIIIFFFYSIILSVRIYIYLHNQYYPAGVDGMIEKVSDFGIRQIFAPAFFPQTMDTVFLKSSLIVHISFIFAYLFNIVPFDFPSALDRSTVKLLFANNLITFITLIKIFVYLLLFVFFILGLIHLAKEIRRRNLKNNPDVFFFVVFLFFLFPITQKITTIRIVLMSSIPLYYFISVGISNCRFKLKPKSNVKKYSSVFLILLLIFTPAYWVFTHPYFVLGVPKMVEAKNTAQFLNTLPEGGIMSQVGYSPELNYQTNKRIISMQHDSSEVDIIIKIFKINYVLYGQKYWEKFEGGNKDRVLNYEVINYIRKNPQKFRLIKIIREEYGGIITPDEIYIYQVI